MLLLLVLALFVAGCSDNKGTPPPRQPQFAPVNVSKAILKTVPIDVQAIGNAEAYSTIAVKSQVAGELTTVDFTEGADVRKGAQLFVIDPRPYQSMVVQAEATLARDKAQL